MAKICQNVPSCLLCWGDEARTHDSLSAACPLAKKFLRAEGQGAANALTTLSVLLLNTGSEPTFVGERGESVIDLTFASVSLYNRVGSWRVSDVYTSSDHKAIVYEILLEENQGVGRAPPDNRRWSSRTLDGDSFAKIVSGMEIESGSTENMVDELMSIIVRACDASMSGGRDRRRREPHEVVLTKSFVTKSSPTLGGDYAMR
uniref:Endonuclease/exonuclease/phosphatase domain-containing protein n=1 Tax=Trichogramma kaykai TaxID=54128 RepID=A0ABD2WMU5_9HYME